MPRFIVNRNAQANGDHEVHNATQGCSYLPELYNQIELGTYLNCHGAVAEANRRWPTDRINGCHYCCLAWHTS